MALRALREAVAELAEQNGAQVPYETALSRWREGVDARMHNARAVPRGR